MLMVPVRLQAWRTEQTMAFFVELVDLEEGGEEDVGSANTVRQLRRKCARSSL